MLRHFLRRRGARVSNCPPLRSAACCSRFSTSASHRDGPSKSDTLTSDEIDELLSNPTWSVEELIPTAGQVSSSTDVTTEQLHHLLRLSALPPPVSPKEELEMLSQLRAQLHFVKQIQTVETPGVEPLQALRDETTAAMKETEIGMTAMRDALDKEATVGKHHKRIRRTNQSPSESMRQAESWDVLGQAPKRVGRFFVVDERDV